MVADREPERPKLAALRPSAPAPASEDDEGAPVVQQPASFAAAPLPPSRPFDLGTIPGAATPIAASKSAKLASYYAPPKAAAAPAAGAAIHKAAAKGKGFVAAR